MHKFAYYAPSTIKEAAAILAKNGPNGRVLAGGTDLLVQIKEHVRGMAPDFVVSVKNIDELKTLKFSARDGATIGSGVTISNATANKSIRERYPALVEGAEIIGSLQIQNIGTIGGNVCNAAPSADSVPPLIAYGASVNIAGPRKTRTVALEDFFVGPGKTVLAPDEILVSIQIPTPPARSGCSYMRHTPRAQMDIAMVGVASYIALDKDGKIADAKIVLGAVAPIPMRARKAEALLQGQMPTAENIAQAAEQAAMEESPISDVRGSAGYRRHITTVLVKRTFGAALQRAMG